MGAERGTGLPEVPGCGRRGSTGIGPDTDTSALARGLGADESAGATGTRLGAADPSRLGSLCRRLSGRAGHGRPKKRGWLFRIAVTLAFAVVGFIGVGFVVSYFSTDPPPALDSYMHGKGHTYTSRDGHARVRLPTRPRSPTSHCRTAATASNATRT